MTVWTMERLQLNARSYPGYLLPRGGTALGLFSAAYHGWNDVIHFHRHNMQITCVDIDQDKLWEMIDVYPAGLECHVQDAWEFAHENDDKRQWDVVSVDTYLGDATERSMESLGLWTSLAGSLVTATISIDAPTPLIPSGWEAFRFGRSPRAEWLVLHR